MQAPFDIAADLDTPVSAYLKLGPFRPRFLLESVEGGRSLARYSFIGFGDALEFYLDADGLRIDLALVAGLDVTAVSVDRVARRNNEAGDKPSDHAPVVVDLSR